MKLIPLYDATAPITCSIGDDERPERIELIERLRTNVQQVDRTEHGLLLRFPDRADIDADLQRFAIDEKRCCQFWGFAVERSPIELTLRWDAPPDARKLLEMIATYLEGDEPITAIGGLL